MLDFADWTRTDLIAFVAVLISLISLGFSFISAIASYSQATSAKRMLKLENSRDAPFIDEVRAERSAYPDYFEVSFRITNRQPSPLDVSRIEVGTRGFRIATKKQMTDWTLQPERDPKAFQPVAVLDYGGVVRAADLATGKALGRVHLFVREPSPSVFGFAHRIARLIRTDQTISLTVVMMSTMQPTSRTSIKVIVKLPSATKAAEIKA